MEIDGQSGLEAPKPSWGWRIVTLLWSTVAFGVCLYLRRLSLAPSLLRHNRAALRQACLGFPIPVMLGATRVRRFCDLPTGTQSLSYRMPLQRPFERIYAYYDEYFRRCGFVPAEPGHPATGTGGSYHDRDHLRVATFRVEIAGTRPEYCTVMVSVRPIASSE